ncbi:MAG: D-glycerate dehydrogenase [Calditrichaeota bacterium]|nr:MAG: D-glycerate dehydrogenase [Calditrichota bacterium]
MYKEKVVTLTRPIPQSQVERLQSEFPNFKFNPENRSLSHDEMLEFVRGAHGILSILTDRIDAEIIAAAGPQLKIIANYAVGYDNIDIECATKQGVFVTNTPGVLTDATADFCWALLLAVTRRIVEADQFSRAGRFDGWAPLLLLGGDLMGKTLGIVGAGRIGTAMAMRSLGWKMRIIYYSNKANPILDEMGAVKVNLQHLLRESDFVSLHVPLTRATDKMINAETLSLMKPSAYLINTSRGKVVDEKALVQSLKNKTIAGAGLDVFEDEPTINQDLIKMNNVVVAPHIGSATIETRTQMAKIAVDNVIAALSGRRPPNLVNPEVWK